MREPKRIGDLLRVLVEQYRLADPDTWSRLTADWDRVSGQPWSGRSSPRSLKDGELVVEASSPGEVRLLRYGVSALVERLGEEYGDGVVRAVKVVPPRRP